ncbi:MAG: hypothetical protein QRY74_02755 [Chlamydia sp.]
MLNSYIDLSKGGLKKFLEESKKIEAHIERSNNLWQKIKRCVQSKPKPSKVPGLIKDYFSMQKIGVQLDYVVRGAVETAGSIMY